MLNGLADSHVERYYTFLQTLASHLNASPEIAQTDLREVIEFMGELAKIMIPEEEKRMKSIRKQFKLSELESEYSWLNWTSYINSILPDDMEVDENEIINVNVPEYFAQLGDLLANVSSRILANYFFTRMVEDASGFLSEEIRQDLTNTIRDIHGTFREVNKKAECIEATNRYLPEAVSALYVRRHFTKEAKKEVEDMVHNIKEVFRETINDLKWMDEKTIKEAKLKLGRITPLIGYPDELIDNKTLIDHYRGLEISKNHYLVSKYNISRTLSDSTYRMLGQKVNKDDWRTWFRAASVTAKYSRVRNTIG